MTFGELSQCDCLLQKQACGQRSAQIDWLPWNRLTSHNRCPRAFWQVTIAPSDPLELLVGRRGLWLWVNTCEGVCCCWLSACKFVSDLFQITNIFYETKRFLLNVVKTCIRRLFGIWHIIFLGNATGCKHKLHTSIHPLFHWNCSNSYILCKNRNESSLHFLLSACVNATVFSHSSLSLFLTDVCVLL